MTIIASTPVAIGSNINEFTEVWSINNEDEIAGGTGTNAAVWQNGQTTYLSILSGDQTGMAAAVGSQGQIVGYSNIGTAIYHSLIWQNGTATQLPTLGADGRAFDISAQGVIVGSAKDENGLAVATEIQNGAVIQLPNLSGGYLSVNDLAVSRAFSINDQGQIVGLAMTANSVQHAVLWQNGEATDLGSITGGGQSIAYDINESGLIVGFATDANGIKHATIWQNGAMTVLPDLSSNGNSVAYSVNNAGFVAGFSYVTTADGNQQQDAVVWENGHLIDLNSFLPSDSGWTLNVAQSINDNNEIVGMGTYVGLTTAFVLSIGDSSTPMISSSAALQSFHASPHSSALSVLDSAANIQSNLDALQVIAAVGKLLEVQFSNGGTPVVNISFQQLNADALAIADMVGNFKLDVEQVTVPVAESIVGLPHVEVGITDSSTAVVSDIGQLQAWAGDLASISFTDPGTPVLSLSTQQISNYSPVLKAIDGSYQLQISYASVADAVTLSAEWPVSLVDIYDSIDSAGAAVSQLLAMKANYELTLTGGAADLATNLNALLSLPAASLAKIEVTDTSSPTLSLSVAQDGNASGLLNALSGDVILSIDASQQADVSIQGAYHVATVAKFSDLAADYSLSVVNGVLQLSDTGTGRTSTDSLSRVSAIEFADQTAFIVSPPSASTITSGNIAELYSAVLARTPDLQGVAFYQNAVSVYPTMSMLQLAGYFLNSAEYKGNSEHNYAESAQGDAQFITDTYENLLHRAPDSGAVPFYQNVIAQFTNGLTAGTAAYAAAQLQGHAQVLVYFSVSSEFIGDVQITAQHPADAQHWLYVI